MAPVLLRIHQVVQLHLLPVQAFLKQEPVRMEYFLEAIQVKPVHNSIEIVLVHLGELLLIDIVIMHTLQQVLHVVEVVQVIFKQEPVMMELCQEATEIQVVAWQVVQAVIFQDMEHFLMDKV